MSQILNEGITYFCIISTRSRTILIKLNDYSFGVLGVRVFLCMEARMMQAALLSRSWGGEKAAWQHPINSAG